MKIWASFQQWVGRLLSPGMGSFDKDWLARRERASSGEFRTYL